MYFVLFSHGDAPPAQTAVVHGVLSTRLAKELTHANARPPNQEVPCGCGCVYVQGARGRGRAGVLNRLAGGSIGAGAQLHATTGEDALNGKLHVATGRLQCSNVLHLSASTRGRQHRQMEDTNLNDKRVLEEGGPAPRAAESPKQTAWDLHRCPAPCRASEPAGLHRSRRVAGCLLAPGLGQAQGPRTRQACPLSTTRTHEAQAERAVFQSWQQVTRELRGQRVCACHARTHAQQCGQGAKVQTTRCRGGASGCRCRCSRRCNRGTPRQQTTTGNWVGRRRKEQGLHLLLHLHNITTCGRTGTTTGGRHGGCPRLLTWRSRHRSAQAWQAPSAQHGQCALCTTAGQRYQ